MSKDILLRKVFSKMGEINKDFRFQIFRPRKNKYIKIPKGTKWDCGCECYYFDTEKGGLKLYKARKEAKNALRRQKIANKKGLAPDLLSDDIIIINLKEDLSGNFYDNKQYKELFFKRRTGKRLYGYYTEKVQIYLSIKYYERPRIDIEKLRHSLSKLYGRNQFRDLRPCNIGVKNGNPIATDFGECSFEKKVAGYEEQ